VSYCVYGIIDPRTDMIFYVGQTSRFEYRKAEHIEGTDQLSGFVIKQMRLNGFVPLFVVLETNKTETDSLSAEIFWIELLRGRGLEIVNAQAVGGYAARRERRDQLAATLDEMSQIKPAPHGLRDLANGRSLRRNKPWTAAEVKRLKGMKRVNMSDESIADALHRTPAEIRKKAKSLKL
jgi:hypothetical protein